MGIAAKGCSDSVINHSF